MTLDEQLRGNVLLTFENVRNQGGDDDIFDRALVAAEKLSVATGMDPTSATIMLGYALEDPVKDLRKLTRVGVSFSDAQRDEISNLVGSGDLVGAQKILLDQVCGTP